MSSYSRRRFLENTLLAAAAAVPSGELFAAGKEKKARPKKKASAGEKLGVAVVGVGGRGSDHLKGLPTAPTPKCCTSSMPTKRSARSGARRSPRSKAASRSGSPTCARPSTTRRSNLVSHRHAQPLALAGRRSGPCRPARTSTSRSRSATTSAKAAAWSRPPASTTASARPARSAARWPASIEAIEYVHDGQDRRGEAGPRPVLQAPRLDRPARHVRSAQGRSNYDLWSGPAPMPAADPPEVPLRLALAVALRQRRPGQPGHPPDGHRPLGPGRQRR